MNKYNGFYELKKLGIPTVKWNEYNESVYLDENKLWTVRVALFDNVDLNLPRAVGVKSTEVKCFVEKVRKEYNDSAFIIYYPYFIAEKSGTIEVKSDGFIVEAVEKDLWNLVTDGKLDVNIICRNHNIEITGNKDFLHMSEFEEICNEQYKIRCKLGKYLREGKSILLEWSYGVDADINKNKIGEKYLIFYECRTL